ncbi:AAA family ATPase [Nonomuraea sp. NPDC050394]|uniref:AAA family ATPase n=1 Tax=Nonomuraea sp. NPDC050394 TaxID=3364363 RepID=UPI0037AB0805
MTNLSVPAITPDQDTLSAALAYARDGWYVLPVNQATKHAGSVLGKGWPAKTSRDPETLIAWFAGQDHALALHVGRSGAVVLDVDRPADLPPLLRAALLTVPGPFQSTREHDPDRGHYLYAVPPGRTLGNSNGHLGKAWGEVRGKNGIIIVAPSEHEKRAQGGRYEWARTGALPELPAVLAEQLPDTGDSSDAATDREVKAFLDTHQGSARPALLHGVLRRFDTAVQAGESRHGSMLAAAAWAMREAAAGLYPAIEAARTLATAFGLTMQTSRDGHERTLTPSQAHAEYQGILAWAIAQTSHADPGTIRDAVEERAPRDDDFSDLLPPGHPQAPPPFETAVDGDEPPVDGVDLEALAFEREVAHEVRRIKVREEAARRARKARQAAAPRPPIIALDAFLAVPDEPVAYRIDRLWPKGGRVVLSAQYKAGKTTLVGNLMRALVDSVPFLDTFAVEPFTGKVVLLDDELDETMVRRWLRDQGIQHTQAAAVVSLRGRLSSFDLLDPETRSEWAADLRASGATVVVLDCLAPILDALGLSEDKEAGRFLVAFDEMLKEAGVQEAVLVHHMGHSGERARGASRLRDWPDVEWRLVREKNDEGESEPNAPRYFSAFGRDVDIAEGLLSFDPSTRRLVLAGGSRKDAKHRGAAGAIIDFLVLSPGASGRQIEDAVSGEQHPQKAVREALKALIADGRVKTSPGSRKANLHWLVDHVNSISAASDMESSALTHSQSIAENDLPTETSALILQRTQTPGHSPNASVRPSASTHRAGSASVRPPKGGRRTDAHAPAHDPRDPTDLVAWTIIDGQRVDPRTGELHPDDLTPTETPR